jgi:SAM-dependent methyltransferase
MILRTKQKVAKMARKQNPEWFRKFFDGLYGRVLAEQFSPDDTLRQARLIKKILNLRKGQSVLDCPCGQGRLTVPLAQMGLLATGVDLTDGFIRQANADASKLPGSQRKRLSFIRQDMREIDFDSQFNAAFNWFTSFGYFSDDENLAFCRRILRALKPGGQFLIEVMNKSWVLSHFQPGHDETVSGVRIVSSCKYNAREGRMDNLWIMSKGRLSERREFSLRLYNGSDLRALLKAAGFADIRLLDHFHEGVGRFTRHSRRFIAVASRPACKLAD